MFSASRDVVIDHASRALAAYRRHASPNREDIYDAAALALAHRARQPLRRDEDETSSPEHGDEQDGSNHPNPNQAIHRPPKANPRPGIRGSERERVGKRPAVRRQRRGHDHRPDRAATNPRPDALDTFNLKRITCPASVA